MTIQIENQNRPISKTTNAIRKRNYNNRNKTKVGSGQKRTGKQGQYVAHETWTKRPPFWVKVSTKFQPRHFEKGRNSKSATGRGGEASQPKPTTLTFLSGLAISGRMLQNGLITSKNLTETKQTRYNRATHEFRHRGGLRKSTPGTNAAKGTHCPCRRPFGVTLDEVEVSSDVGHSVRRVVAEYAYRPHDDTGPTGGERPVRGADTSPRHVTWPLRWTRPKHCASRPFHISVDASFRPNALSVFEIFFKMEFVFRDVFVVFVMNFRVDIAGNL